MIGILHYLFSMIINCKNIVVLVFAFSLPLVSVGQSDPCLLNFRQGKYELIEKRTDGYYIIRTENEQVEIFNDGDSKVISKINWISNSEYNLITIKLINVPKTWGQKKGVLINVKIIECNEHSYRCKVWKEGKPPAEFELVKIAKY
jgi:hypothetical protein